MQPNDRAQMQRRVPRHDGPPVNSMLNQVKRTIDRTHAEMQKLEEAALSGYHEKLAYADGPSDAYAAQREENEARQWRQPPATGVLGSGYGGTTGLKGAAVQPDWPTPIMRASQAYERVAQTRHRLENAIGNLIGPLPESDTAEANPPNPWGGQMGEVCNLLDAIQRETARINYLLDALATLG